MLSLRIMKTTSERIDKQLAVMKKNLIESNDFIDLASIRRLFRPALSEKVAKDRLVKLRDSDDEFYLIEDSKLHYKLINRNVNWTLFKFLQEKKSIQNKPVVKTSIYDRGMAANITILHIGMEKHVYVEIRNYTAVSSGKNADYLVFPLKMIISDTPYILAYDREAKKVKQFNIGRMGCVELSTEKANLNPLVLLKKEVLDDFGFNSANNKHWDIELLMTNYAMTMFVRDFQYLSDRIKTVKPSLPAEIVNGEEYHFQYSIKLKVGSIRVIGRFVTGILAHVKVSKAPDEFKKALRGYIQDTVIVPLNKNI